MSMGRDVGIKTEKVSSLTISLASSARDARQMSDPLGTCASFILYF